jgi:ribose 5-phosphate isomerase B
MTRLSREHNDANVLCVGSRFTSLDDAKRFWEIFSTTPFEGGRHQARVNKLSGPLSDNS